MKIKKRFTSSLVLGGAVISLIVMLAVTMVFIALDGDELLGSEHKEAGLPTLIGGGEESDNVIPGLIYGEESGMLEASFASSVIFKTERSLRIDNVILLKANNAAQKEIVSVRYSLYSGTKCIITDFLNIEESMKSPFVVGKATLRHTVHFNEKFEGPLSLVYTVTYKTDNGYYDCQCKRSIE